jgi:hypothetical protein
VLQVLGADAECPFSTWRTFSYQSISVAQALAVLEWSDEESVTEAELERLVLDLDKRFPGVSERLCNGGWHELIALCSCVLMLMRHCSEEKHRAQLAEAMSRPRSQREASEEPGRGGQSSQSAIDLTHG